jgi:DNA-binding beta-propeller fold protein YncE
MEVAVDLEMGGGGDGPGRFAEPWEAALDGRGHLFISDFGGNRIQEFDAQGRYLRSFGRKGQKPGEFDQPSGLYAHPDGELYVCDTFNHRIQVFKPGKDEPRILRRNFFGPRSVAGNGTDRIYVCDTGNHKIQAFDGRGQFLMEWGGPGTEEGKFQEPVGLTVDPEGFVYVADSDNLRIQKFDPNGKLAGVIKVAFWNGKNRETPYLSWGSGSLFATNTSQGTVLRYSPRGKLEAILRRKDGFSGPAGLEADPMGRLYVVERGARMISRVVLPSGKP